MTWRLVRLLLACCGASALAVAASPGGTLRADALDGAGWRAKGVEVAWRWRSDGTTGVVLAIDALTVDGVGSFRALRLDCPAARLDADSASCARATVGLVGAGEVPLHADLGFRYAWTGGDLALDLHRLELCAGRVEGSANVAASAWRAALRLSALDARCLAGLARPEEGLPVDVTAGRVSGDLDLGFDRSTLALTGDLATVGLAFGDAAGTVAGEALDARLRATLHRTGTAWQGTLELHASRGVLFRDPVLLDAALAPLVLRAEGRTTAGGVEVTAIDFDQGATLNLSGHLALQDGALAVADLAFASTAPGGLYDAWLQPLLIGTALDDLELAGALRGRLHGAAARWDVSAELDDLALLDRRGRFALGGLDGTLAWGGAETPPSRLSWAGGHYLGLAVGASGADFTLRNGTLRLLAPLRQPLVDGALAVAELEATGVGGPGARVTLEATLEPVSLEALGYAFGWPRMAGQVGGAVPSLRYADGTLAVAGELRVDVFDGAIRLRDLRLERPLGPLAALHADIAVDDIDLELLTRTFTIGRIQGRLGGRIDGLLLHDWRPVRFDAELATPPGDTSRHRISQRAVDSITSIGGLGGVLSQSALRFFDEFGYSRLGFRCRLRGAVCELDGVEPAASGYYLVKGGGLPRIDIIGHVRRVDWAELVDRIQRAMAAPAPVIR